MSSSINASSQTNSHYDFIIIGAGPAGESASLYTSKKGYRTAIVDAQLQVGGNCTHWGTIPSKALRKYVRDIIHFKRNPMLNNLIQDVVFEYPEMLKSASKVIDKQVNLRGSFYLENNIRTYSGLAEFQDQNTIKIALNDGTEETLTADKFILTTGSRPYHPEHIDFTHERVYDSDSILAMDHTPRKLIIYGAGVIGCEYASIFSTLNMKVDLVNTRDRLLEFLDDEITDALSYKLSRTGCVIRHREQLKSFEANNHGVTLHLESGKTIQGDALLWCNGRTGNTDQLNLEAIGLTANNRGQLKVDAKYKTEVDNVYAAGDIIGWPSLASAAYQQGISAARAATGKEEMLSLTTVPTGIYTLPEISSVGLTERELTDKKIPYEVGRAFFPDIARGQIWGQKAGMLKLLFNPETLEVLGVHCFGIEATEIIHIGQAIMEQKNGGNTIRFFIESTFNYPTMAEAYRIAAFNGMNRIGL